MLTPAAPGPRVGKEQFLGEDEVLSPGEFCWGDRSVTNHPTKAACFVLGSKAAAASAVQVSERATSRESSLSASSAQAGCRPLPTHLLSMKLVSVECQPGHPAGLLHVLSVPPDGILGGGPSHLGGDGVTGL